MLSLSDLMKLEFSGKILEKYSNNNFMKIRSVGACGWDGEGGGPGGRRDGQTDVTSEQSLSTISRTPLKSLTWLSKTDINLEEEPIKFRRSTLVSDSSNAQNVDVCHV